MQSRWGEDFEDPIPQRIHVLSSPPRYPGADGSPRGATVADAPLLFEWLVAFHKEAVPHDPPPEQANIEKLAAGGRFLLLDEQTAGLSPSAAISRRLRHTAAIAPVYTPPEQRGRGYAGSVTAAVVDRVFSEGKTAACLYTDLRNPCSNRCYAKIGFKPLLRLPGIICERADRMVWVPCDTRLLVSHDLQPASEKQ